MMLAHYDQFFRSDHATLVQGPHCLPLDAATRRPPQVSEREARFTVKENEVASQALSAMVGLPYLSGLGKSLGVRHH